MLLLVLFVVFFLFACGCATPYARTTYPAAFYPVVLLLVALLFLMIRYPHIGGT